MERVVFGIDAHKSSLAACAVDPVGRPLTGLEVANTPTDHRRLLAWAREEAPHGRLWAIESAHGYARYLSGVLLAAGEQVVEVPGRLTQRERRRLRQLGKSDRGDALAIGRVALREPLEPVVLDEATRELKLLVDYRRNLIRERTRIANRVHADLVSIAPGYERRVAHLMTEPKLAAAERVLGRLAGAQARLARRRIAQLRLLDNEIGELGREVQDAVLKRGTSLVEIVGVGPILAAVILGEVGDVRRIPTRDKFASLNGTAPLQASSGRIQRHRFNPLGNRRLNWALHQIAFTQARCDPRARAYVAKHLAQAKSRRDAIRALKRRLSDVVYRHLIADAHRLHTDPPEVEPSA